MLKDYVHTIAYAIFAVCDVEGGGHTTLIELVLHSVFGRRLRILLFAMHLHANSYAANGRFTLHHCAVSLESANSKGMNKRCS